MPAEKYRSENKRATSKATNVRRKKTNSKKISKEVAVCCETIHPLGKSELIITRVLGVNTLWYSRYRGDSTQTQQIINKFRACRPCMRLLLTPLAVARNHCLHLDLSMYAYHPKCVSKRRKHKHRYNYVNTRAFASNTNNVIRLVNFHKVPTKIWPVIQLNLIYFLVFA